MSNVPVWQRGVGTGEGSKAIWATPICKQHILKRCFSICVDSDKFAVENGWEGNRSFSITSVLCPALCLECTVHHTMQKWGPQKSWAVLNHALQSLIDDTKILTKTDSRFFFRYQIFWNRDIYSETEFYETVTFFRDQIHWNQKWYFFPGPNSPKPITLKNWKNSCDRDRNRDLAISLTIFEEISSKYLPPFPSLFFLLLQKKNVLLLRIFSSVFFLVFLLLRNSDMRRGQIFQKEEYGLPAKIWRHVRCTKMISW